jgi:AraC-like DNA-binding protein
VSLPGEPGPGPETGTGPDCIRSVGVPGDLGRVVGQAMIYRETIPAGVTVRERVLPDGAVRIVVNLPADQEPSLRVLGPSTAPESVPLRGSMRGLSLTVRPEAARALLGLPIGEIAGFDLPLTELWAGEAACLASRLGEAKGVDALTEILWAAIRRRMARASKDILPANLSGLLGAGGAWRPGHGAHRRGLGERRVQQLYREHIGLSPRAAKRLARWHGLLRALRRVDRPDWSALAVEHGWYDQAHLCRDFRGFAGLTPSGYFTAAFSGSSKTTDASVG